MEQIKEYKALSEYKSLSSESEGYQCSIIALKDCKRFLATLKQTVK